MSYLKKQISYVSADSDKAMRDDELYCLAQLVFSYIELAHTDPEKLDKKVEAWFDQKPMVQPSLGKSEICNIDELWNALRNQSDGAWERLGVPLKGK